MTAEPLPWICPDCGHFIVRVDRVRCRRCNRSPAMVTYLGSQQADEIRASAQTR